MVDSATHYRVLLAKHYSWMIGADFEQVVAGQAKEFADLGAGKGRRALAVDLGCGPGHQAAALADLGFGRVIAIDMSGHLLEELRRHRGARPIEAVCADILNLAQYVSDGSADLVLCWGDSLTHLDTVATVQDLLKACWQALRSGGRLLLSFRSYTEPLRGSDRVFPVRLDVDRLMTCSLDYTEDRVEVTDLIYLRKCDGWDVQKSSYRKLRLASEDIVRSLHALGFQAELHPGRMVTIVAVKAARLR